MTDPRCDRDLLAAGTAPAPTKPTLSKRSMFPAKTATAAKPPKSSSFLRLSPEHKIDIAERLIRVGSNDGSLKLLSMDLVLIQQKRNRLAITQVNREIHELCGRIFFEKHIFQFKSTDLVVDDQYFGRRTHAYLERYSNIELYRDTSGQQYDAFSIIDLPPPEARCLIRHVELLLEMPETLMVKPADHIQNGRIYEDK